MFTNTQEFNSTQEKYHGISETFTSHLYKSKLKIGIVSRIFWGQNILKTDGSTNFTGLLPIASNVINIDNIFTQREEDQ